MNPPKPMFSRLFEKSVEAFLLAVENYNKPTIRYRVEAFAIFICNAWELLLKGYLIKTQGLESIYYQPSKDVKRTFSLERCVKTILTNEKDPVRLNLEKIVELRNTSTHFITEEYEMLYIPLFQACIFNYSDKLSAFANISLGDRVSLGFLSLTTTMNTFSIDALRGKYSSDIFEHISRLDGELNTLAGANGPKFAIPVEHRFYLTKKREEASECVTVVPKSDNPVAIIKTQSDPNSTHSYSLKKIIDFIKNRLREKNINLLLNGAVVNFNKYHCCLLIDYFALKKQPDLCYIDKHDQKDRYYYSQKAVDFILGELCKDPGNILTELKAKTAPGAKENSKQTSGS